MRAGTVSLVPHHPTGFNQETPYPSAVSPQPLATTNLLSVFMEFTPLRKLTVRNVEPGPTTNF